MNTNGKTTNQEQGVKTKLLGFIAALSLSLAILITGTAGAEVSSWQQGVSIRPSSASDFGTSSFQQSVDNAATTGVNHVTLIIPVHQSNIYSTDVAMGSDTPTDASLASAVRYIQSKGMGVSFAIHVDPYDRQWRALINPDDRAAWFANYGAILNRYASLGQDLGVGQYVLGTELSSMTDPSVRSSNTEYWRRMIQDVRARYSGILTYSAQHSTYKADLMTLGFWPQLDKIGISAYYGLSSEASPSVDAVKARWDYWNNSQVRVISERYSKPVIFTEVGYVSQDYGLRDPGDGWSLDTPYNGQLQATGYQALFEYWNNYSYVQGVSLWDWKSSPQAGGTGDRDFTPQNKPAQQVMKQWFADSGMRWAPAPSPAPTPAPSPSPSQPATYTAGGQASSPAVVNTPVTVTMSLAASRSVIAPIVDIEIYNGAGQRVSQKVYENQALGTNPVSFAYQWTPGSTGEYTVKVGVFSSGWQSTVYWNNAAYSLTVGTAAAQPSPTPTPTPTPAPSQPQPTQPAPTAPATLSVWWPSDGATVTGVQPFKAVVDGRDFSQYKIYWQVDGGQLNGMGDATNPVPHKVSYVDLSSWKWNATGKYILKFVAKDGAGSVIAEKSAAVTVS